MRASRPTAAAAVLGSDFQGAGRIALLDPNVEGNPVLAVMDIEAVETVTDAQMAAMTEKVYRTTDPEHPGVAAFNGQGRVALPERLDHLVSVA